MELAYVPPPDHQRLSEGNLGRLVAQRINTSLMPDPVHGDPATTWGRIEAVALTDTDRAPWENFVNEANNNVV